MGDHKFYRGDLVEVCEKLNGNSSGYSIFYPAKIGLVYRKQCSVLYETRFEEDGKKRKSALVNLANVRPKPPESDYNEGDVVDIFVQNAWWSDQTLRQLQCPCCSRMLDFSMRTPKEKDANSGNVRPHYDWENGEWIKPVRNRPAEISGPHQDVNQTVPTTLGDADAAGHPSGPHQDVNQTAPTTLGDTDAAGHPSTSTVSAFPPPFTSSPQVARDRPRTTSRTRQNFGRRIN